MKLSLLRSPRPRGSLRFARMICPIKDNILKVLPMIALQLYKLFFNSLAIIGLILATIFSQNVEFEESEKEKTYYHFYKRKPYFYGLYAMIFLFGILNQYFISRFYFQSKKKTSRETEDVEMLSMPLNR